MMANRMMQLGDKFPHEFPPEGGIVFDLTDNGGVLAYSIPSPSDAEIAQINSGKSVGIYKEEDATFMLWRFGKIPWMDTPYNSNKAVSLSDDKLDQYKCALAENNGDTIGVELYTVDANDNSLVGIGLFAMPRIVAIELVDLSIRQREATFDQDADQRQVENIQSQMSAETMSVVANTQGMVAEV